MASILDEPAVRRAVFPISVEFYHQAGGLGLISEDVELLEGNLVKKMSKSPTHSWLVQLLLQLLQGSLPVGFSLRQEQPLTFLRSEPEPDLAVVRGSLKDFRHAHPATAELVIEVAISTVEVDRQKAAIYAGGDVKEYWLVIPEAGCVEVYRCPTEGGYREQFVVTGPARLESSAVPGFSVPLAELFQA